MIKNSLTIYKQNEIAKKQLDQIEQNEEILNELLNMTDDEVISKKDLREKVEKATGIFEGEGIVSILLKKIQPKNIFRIRKYEKNEEVDVEKLDLRKWDKEEDLWNPPSDVVTRGRFNSKGESLLYTSYSIETCVLETKIKENDIFLLITYKPIKELSLCGLMKEENIYKNEKLLKINKIYTECLTKSQLLANCIKEVFYNLKSGIDGWECLSISYYNKENLKKDFWKKYIENIERYANLILLSENIKNKLEIFKIEVMQRKNNENKLLYTGELKNGRVIYNRIKEK